MNGDACLNGGHTVGTLQLRPWVGQIIQVFFYPSKEDRQWTAAIVLKEEEDGWFWARVFMLKHLAAGFDYDVNLCLDDRQRTWRWGPPAFVAPDGSIGGAR